MSAHRTARKLRGIGRPFESGHDPRRNLGGRPPLSEEVKEAFRAGVPEAIAKLQQLVRGDNPRLALEAAIHWLNRALGKPTERHSFVEDEAPGWEIRLMRIGEKLEENAPSLEPPHAE